MNRRSLITAAAMSPFIATPTTFARQAETSMSYNFNREPFVLNTLNESDLSFTEDKIQELGVGGHFENDIKRIKRGGEVFDHPLTIAQYVMRLLNNYRFTGNEIYLQHAELNLDRAADGEEVSDGRGLYPYAFDHVLTSEPNGTLIAPWVSGMTQGQVLQAYNRHKRITGSDRYSQPAQRALASFRPINDTSFYWSPTTDVDGNLWLEEYPGTPPTKTLNGHIFTIFGLYEQWLMSPEPWLTELIQGAITTVKNLAMNYRREGQPSRYWGITEKYADRYHVIHIAQMLELYSMTGDVAFAQIADTYWMDYPPYTFIGRFFLGRGKYEVFHYDSDKPSIIFGEAETVTLNDVTEVRTSQRRRLPESNEFWYYCASQPFTRMWMKEDPSIDTMALGEYVGIKSIGGPLYGSRMVYSPSRLGRTLRHVTNGYLASGGDARFPAQTIDVPAGEHVSIESRELISGQDFSLVIGPSGEFWIPSADLEFDTVANASVS